ncbi:MAG TPA: hypothetical protein VFH90_01095 [Candidatus Limnocylindria bacterium]|nr:hypothetical protein [Candidatus Limnocylindria bacterium]
MTASEDNSRPHRIEWENKRFPVGPGPEEITSFDPRRLDFGHYAGRTIEELAKSDPDYVDWLSRHPSGARYRGEIMRVRGVATARTRF